LYTGWPREILAFGLTIVLQVGVVIVTRPFQILEIDKLNVSEMAQDRDIVTTED